MNLIDRDELIANLKKDPLFPLVEQYGLTSVIEALSRLKEPCEVTLTSDSKYVCDGISKGWAAGWKKKGWKKSDGSPALNPDLWDKLLSLCEVHKVTFVWVKGHAGHPYNERCDAMAQAESGKYL
jgi:ribonuclease HI